MDVESAALLAGEEGGPRDTEAMPLPLPLPLAAPVPGRRDGREDDIARSGLSSRLSLSARSVIAAVARAAAERRGRADMVGVSEKRRRAVSGANLV